MAKLTPMTDQFQHFLDEVKEDFWGDVYSKTKLVWKRYFETESQRQRDRYCGFGWYERGGQRKREHRNGYYERDFVIRFGTLRLRIARSRNKNFLPKGLQRFQRRADEVTLLIREAFLRGISTRTVGRIVAIMTGEVVSAQTVSQLTRELDEAVQRFHRARLSDEWKTPFLDGVSLRVRRPSGRKRVQMLVAYVVRADGSRQLVVFMRSSGESQAAREGLLGDLYRRGVEGNNLELIVTDGCAGLAAAIETIYPRVQHQRRWAHKMRNIVNSVRKCNRDQIKRDAQAIYQADSRREALAAFRRLKRCWHKGLHQDGESIGEGSP